MIPTHRRIEYAQGYLALGLINEASEELEAIASADRLSDAVLEVRCELYHVAKHWELLLAVARGLARQNPGNPHGWISWAYALRVLERVAEARDILLEAEPHHPRLGVLHFNLGCYYCLLGAMEEATHRVRRACQLGKEWKEAALDDPDLRALWDEIAKL